MPLSSDVFCGILQAYLAIIMQSGNTRYVVLLIDAESRKYLRRLSESLSVCAMIVKPDIQDACQYFFHNHVDIVLLDCSREDNINELRFFKSVKPSVPVIVMTSSGSEEFAVAAFRHGARDYFKKPFSTAELEARIRSILLFRPGSRRRKSDHCVDNFRTAVQHIIDNYNVRLKLPDVSRIAGMSVSCFERAFRKNMGTTFTRYINNIRIDRSAKMLGEGGFSVSEIAFICGFTNQFHFTRTFKKIMSVSPSTFRNSVRTIRHGE